MINLGAKIENVAKNAGPLVLGVLSITVAFVLLLLSQALGLGTLTYHDYAHGIDKEVGFLSAPNWTIVYAVLFPVYLCLFAVLIERSEFTLRSLLQARVITGPSGAAVTEDALFSAWNMGLKKISLALWALLIVVVVQTSVEWLSTCLGPLLNESVASNAVDWSTLAATAQPSKPSKISSILFSLVAYLYMGFALFIYLSILVYVAGFCLFLNKIADPSGNFRLVLRDVTLGARLSDIGMNFFFCAILGLGAGFMMRLQAIYLETNYSHVTDLLFSDFLGWAGRLQTTAGERIAEAFSIPSGWTSLLEVAFTLLMLFTVVYLLHDTFEKARQYYIDHADKNDWCASMGIECGKDNIEAIRRQAFLATVFPNYVHMGVVVIGVVFSLLFIGHGSIAIATVLYAGLQFGVLSGFRRERERKEQEHHTQPQPHREREQDATGQVIISNDEIEHQDRELLVTLLATQAAAEGSVSGYFRRLILQANVPERFRLQRQDGWSGAAETDARELINWAIVQDVNPSDTRFTTLGSILEPELSRVGFEKASVMVALIIRYRLFRDDRLLADLRRRFLVPVLASGVPNTTSTATGPAINWCGPDDDIQLQAWLTPEPDFLDVGYLRNAILRSASVCLVKVGMTNATGTGVLIDTDLVLTNYHVLAAGDGSVQESALTTELIFGLVTGKDDHDSHAIRLDPACPVVMSSPISELDFVLLRAENRIRDLAEVRPAQFVTTLPPLRSSLNILQHPQGQEMKLALSSNGVTSVQDSLGRIQYLTKAAEGSSGSPCFDANWNLVALHHAERSRSFGSIREGILMGSIYRNIGQHLTVRPI
jgi:hypothetical protein